MKTDNTYSIKPAENGYIVDHSYREQYEPKAGGDPDFSYRYKNKHFLFMKWEDVAAWIKDNSLEIPPK